MFPYPFLEAAYMAKMSGGGKVKPITITENGTYNVSDAEKAEGYVGFAPVTVDVPQQGGGDGLSAQTVASFPSVAAITFGEYEFSVRKRSISALWGGQPVYPPFTVPDDGAVQTGIYHKVYAEYYRLLCKNGVPIIGAYHGRDTSTESFYKNSQTEYKAQTITSQITSTSITTFSTVDLCRDGGRVSIVQPYQQITERFSPSGEIISSQTKYHTNSPYVLVFPFSSENMVFTNTDLTADELMTINQDVAEVFYNTYCTETESEN